MEIIKSSKVLQKYSCEYCDYNTCYYKDYKKHLLTKKHMEIKGTVEEIQKVLICLNCEKEFKTNSGLWKHKQKCNKSEEVNEIINKTDDEQTDKHLILKILKQNSDLIKENFELRKEQTDIKEMILGIVKNGTINNSHNTTNSHNKAFNLNFFLNETCKDTMNITEFVDSINLQFSDLEKVGEVGYIEGISNIIIKNLNALDETKRPVHCTDKKREIIYVKDQGQWEKEDNNKTKIKRLISKVSTKNSKLLTQYREKYPDCKKCDSKISDKFNKMVIEAMGGQGENNIEKEEKIIRNISKATIISSRNS